MDQKKFISPHAWFSLQYPHDWHEFEDEADTFLFYNPDKWTGNFRISALKEENIPDFGHVFVTGELKSSLAEPRTVGNMPCAYTRTEFWEDGTYVTHKWIIGLENMGFVCSFTTTLQGDIRVAERMISSIEVRKDGEKYPPEVIPVRVVEEFEVDEACRRV
ncbi:MAG: DUF3805 domain-containing protein, partial [Prevotellaceae bacterium]|nr:DUF3805 domain-containing protein [Prevotellaceae bacterium]